MERQNKTAAKSQETVFMYRLRFNSLKAFNFVSRTKRLVSYMFLYTTWCIVYSFTHYNINHSFL